ncbi:glutaredoxin, GrxB family [Veronia nyctiphanis]|uniref:Glutaredoxin, GrxB family n=1 Tax=Veronia nyctiphanis TaxID=1278244 RepID=A0A4Q0YZ86_9GAMM|nr:glutaredoxin 2 [Veronia nyctiphanis]RXJ74441.1 glutaredoxin, GrxB family [Veronia nyctiphanis]
MKMFVFDHCPYCIRAMMMNGLKKLEIETVYLQNHDVEARIEKVGANMVPILQKEDGSYMGESLDIVKYLDEFDGNPVLQASASEEKVAAWYKRAYGVSQRLVYPRWMRVKLPEFGCHEAKEWFTKNKSAAIEMSFDDAFVMTESYLGELNVLLKELDWLVLPSERDNTLTYDDITFFPVLRNFTVVKGIIFPPRVRNYIDEISSLTDINLYDDIAV